MPECVDPSLPSLLVLNFSTDLGIVLKLLYYLSPPTVLGTPSIAKEETLCKAISLFAVLGSEPTEVLFGLVAAEVTLAQDRCNIDL